MNVADLTLLVINTFLSFYVSVLFVEVIIYKCQHFRTKVFCRLIPVLKLPIDFVVLFGTGKNFLVNLNPYLCEKYFYKILIRMPWIEFILIALFACSVLLTLRKLIQVYVSIRFFNRICKNSSGIVYTNELELPCAYGFGHIIMPHSVKSVLSVDEYEAVIAHERTHLHYFDPVIKIVVTMIQNLFWWIPMKWWVQKLEQDQESACDMQSDKDALLSAIYKLVTNVKIAKLDSVTCSFSQMYRRMHILSCYTPKQTPVHNFIVVSVSLASALSLSFWIC